MATKKKRTSLAALISPVGVDVVRPAHAAPARKSREPTVGKSAAASDFDIAEIPTSKGEIVRQTLYLPLPVFDQLRDLFFEEQRGRVKRRRMHDYFLEGIDLLFKDRGLKSIEDLAGKK